MLGWGRGTRERRGGRKLLFKRRLGGPPVRHLGERYKRSQAVERDLLGRDDTKPQPDPGLRGRRARTVERMALQDGVRNA